MPKYCQIGIKYSTASKIKEEMPIIYFTLAFQ